MKLKNRVSLVTGAGSGIGEAIAKTLANEGATVVLIDRDRAGIDRVAADVAAAGGEAFPIVADVTSSTDVKRVVEQVTEEFGTIYALINNAGVGVAADVLHTTDEAWELMMNVNLKGQFLFCREVVPVMLKQGYGRIINIASAAGVVGVKNRVGYCASKAGVIGLTNALACDLASTGIRINAISPGTIDSPWIQKVLSNSADPEGDRAKMQARQPIGRMGKPEEIAYAALYLASPENEFTHGSNIIIDGGLCSQ